MLRALEQRKEAKAEPEFVPSDDEAVINLEHVLPENPGGLWPGIDEDTATAYFRRIGNFCLLQAEKNTSIGNGAFDKKKPVLKASQFKTTSEVGDEASWGTKEIAERQKRLAKLAVETWPISA